MTTATDALAAAESAQSAAIAALRIAAPLTARCLDHVWACPGRARLTGVGGVYDRADALRGSAALGLDAAAVEAEIDALLASPVWAAWVQAGRDVHCAAMDAFGGPRLLCGTGSTGEDWLAERG